MKQHCWFFLLLILMLSSCSQIAADVPDNPDALAAQVIVEEYIQAYQSYDMAKCSSLFADDATYQDVSNDFQMTGNTIIRSGLQEEIHRDTFRVKFESYLVTEDGRFAVIQAVYSHKNFQTEPWESAPYIIILEIQDGKIIRATLYTSKIIF